MKKQSILTVVLISSTTLLADGDWRAPLSLMHSHNMRLKPVEKAWWYDLMPSKKDENSTCCKWHVHKWVSMYSRSAGYAFEATDGGDGTTTRTTSLANLFFGKSTFKIADAFPRGNIDDIAQLNKYNPLIAAAYLTPSYEYNEKGICFGGHVNYTIKETNWHIGVSAGVPINVVEVKPNTTLGKSEETLEDLFKIDVIKATTGDSGATVQYKNDLAIRADFLNSLMLDETTTLVQKDGTQLKVGYSTINGSSATNAEAYLIKKPDHNPPDQPYRKTATAVSGSLTLSGNGVDDQVFYVNNVSDYELANSDVESTLWLVPKQKSATSNELTDLSQNMVSQIEYAVYIADLANRTASEFLTERGLLLHTYERRAGLGDLKFCLNATYHNQEDDWFVKIVGGAKCPTGSKRDAEKALRVLQLETGNNGHWELFAGLAVGLQPFDWMSFDVYATANHVFSRDQWLPAAFEGATVKNMGPAVEGKISWDYFTAQANLNFFHPHNPELGCTLGYSLFAKNKDHVHYQNPDATDFFENKNQPLDSDVAAMKTKAMTHAIRAEVFHRWNYFQLKAGGSYDIAGRHAMKSTEAHIGMSISF